MSEVKVKVSDGVAPILVPRGSSVSKDPIEGGVAVVHASIPPSEDGHVTYRTQTQAESGEQASSLGWSRQRSLAFLRMERNRLLAESDWVELPSAQARFTQEQRVQWHNYRETLRDLPETVDPDDFDWPAPPQ